WLRERENNVDVALRERERERERERDVALREREVGTQCDNRETLPSERRCPQRGCYLAHVYNLSERIIERGRYS
ncbi:hypothetical protein L9F63_011969, partial [Diploptera punctata]